MRRSLISNRLHNRMPPREVDCLTVCLSTVIPLSCDCGCRHVFPLVLFMLFLLIGCFAVVCSSRFPVMQVVFRHVFVCVRLPCDTSVLGWQVFAADVFSLFHMCKMSPVPIFAWQHSRVQFFTVLDARALPREMHSALDVDVFSSSRD